MNSQGAPKKTFENFLIERRMIPFEIEQFLRNVLLYCVDKEDNYGLKQQEIGTPYGGSLILSLCKVHRLYGYPTQESTGDSGRS